MFHQFFPPTIFYQKLFTKIIQPTIIHQHFPLKSSPNFLPECATPWLSSPCPPLAHCFQLISSLMPRASSEQKEFYSLPFLGLQFGAGQSQRKEDGMGSFHWKCGMLGAWFVYLTNNSKDVIKEKRSISHSPSVRSPLLPIGLLDGPHPPIPPPLSLAWVWRVHKAVDCSEN